MGDFIDSAAAPLSQLASHYAVRDEVAIEDFEDGSLALLCEQLRLVQLNPTARDILGRLNGARSVREVAGAVARAYGQPLDVVLSDVADLLADLEGQGVVERRGRTRGDHD
jgi:hypothetical protein